MNSIVNRLLYIYVVVFSGFIAGFNIAWLTMKITWIDMRFPTEIFIPAGMILGLIYFGMSFFIRIPKPFVIGAKLTLIVSTLLVITTFLLDVRAALYVAPIMVRTAFRLNSLSPVSFWISLTISLLILIISLRLLNSSTEKERKLDKSGILERRQTEIDEA